MAELIKLIKESFEVSVRMRWLKEIEKAIDKRNKTYQDYRRQELVIAELVNRFNELYHDSKLNWKGE